MVRWMLVAGLALSVAVAQQRENTDEAKVGNYTLPDPLTMRSGQLVKDARTWAAERRPELMKIFEEQVFGRTVAPKTKVVAEVVEAGTPALGGKAVRKQVRLWFAGKKEGPKVDVLMYLPAGAGKPAPVFMGLNFGTNASVVADPGIRLGDSWLRDPQDRNKRVKTATPESVRGSDAESWQVEKILAQGFGLVTASYQDIEPDFDGGMAFGIRPLGFRAGQTAPGADEWGAIGAWAWGLSRMVDWVVTERGVDAKKIALIGHSRLGKTALWAGAQDSRFALVVSNDSGEGGAALARRNYGETLEQITRNFPHWFCANYKQYADDPNRLPVDSHELLALIAPRPVYVASAEEDRHADPRGEFLGAVGAGRVYELLGKQGLGTDEMPRIHQPIMKTVGYHIRAGKHDVTAYDWDQYLKFARMHFGR